MSKLNLKLALEDGFSAEPVFLSDRDIYDVYALDDGITIVGRIELINGRWRASCDGTPLHWSAETAEQAARAVISAYKRGRGKARPQ